jgi:hypothetical protein
MKAAKAAKERRAKPRNGKQAAPSTAYTGKVASLLSRRDHHIGEIKSLRLQLESPAPFLGKAEALLTRYWARTDWDGRAKILGTVAWLIGMARLQAVTAAATKRKAAGARRDRPKRTPKSS